MIKMDGKEIGPVQRGIPIPKPPGGKAGPERTAIEELDAGESRMFSGVSTRFLVGTCASIRKRYPERRFSVRTISAVVVRVWRTE